MRNPYKKILFECHTPNHKAVAGRMRFWHIHRQGCYPNGCKSDDGFHAPNLIVSEEDYKVFLKKFKRFHRWAQKTQSQKKISFTGIIDRIYPRFSILLLDNSPIFKYNGFVMVFKECMIHKDFIEDSIYILLDLDILKHINLNVQDTIRGSARFRIDERGIITLYKVTKVRVVHSVFPRKEWFEHEIFELNLRAVDYIYQDHCMECPLRLLATKSNSRGRKYYSNIFLCSLKSCIHQGKIDAP